MSTLVCVDTMGGSCRVVIVIASSWWWCLSRNRRDRSLSLLSMVVVFLGSPGVTASYTLENALMPFHDPGVVLIDF